jgi:hypothetical protein
MHSTNWEFIKQQPGILCPLPFLGLDRLINRWVAPWLPWLCLCNFVVGRPRLFSPRREYTATVVVPARNEADNIAAGVKRIQPLGAGTEIIFVEGHSKDNTWAEIQRVADLNRHVSIKCLQHAREKAMPFAKRSPGLTGTS